MTTTQKTFKRNPDGKIILENVIYDTSINKRVIAVNPNTGNKIDSIKIDDQYYYPVGLVKKKDQK